AEDRPGEDLRVEHRDRPVGPEVPAVRSRARGSAIDEDAGRDPAVEDAVPHVEALEVLPDRDVGSLDAAGAGLPAQARDLAEVESDGQVVRAAPPDDAVDRQGLQVAADLDAAAGRGVEAAADHQRGELAAHRQGPARAEQDIPGDLDPA